MPNELKMMPEIAVKTISGEGIILAIPEDECPEEEDENITNTQDACSQSVVPLKSNEMKHLSSIDQQKPQEESLEE